MIAAKTLAGLFVLGIGLSAAPNDEIAWSKDELLAWSDFQGHPISSSPHGALSSVGITLSHEQQGEEVVFVVKSVFYKRRSWVKSTARTNTMLKHEQGHFDLTEIYARQLRKEIAALGGKAPSRVKKAYHLFSNLNKELDACQVRYDTETKHHLDTEAQDCWNIWISEQLER